MIITPEAPSPAYNLRFQWHPDFYQHETPIALNALREYALHGYRPGKGNIHAIEEYGTTLLLDGLWKLESGISKARDVVNQNLDANDVPSSGVPEYGVTSDDNGIKILYRSLVHYTEDPTGEIFRQKAAGTEPAYYRLKMGYLAARMIRDIQQQASACIEGEVTLKQPFGFSRAFQELEP